MGILRSARVAAPLEPLTAAESQAVLDLTRRLGLFPAARV
jgi:hypothetical protein